MRLLREFLIGFPVGFGLALRQIYVHLGECDEHCRK
jgi:hypothetical protein